MWPCAFFQKNGGGERIGANFTHWFGVGMGLWLLFWFFSASISSGLLAQIAQFPIIRVDEIRPGMRGYGLTVFKGTEPERFEVEVIDVLHRFRPDQDLILIRTSHPILSDAPTVAGMSGSPIFIDGKLAGAYAYGWLFGRHPVAGVTPIENMLRELARKPRSTPPPLLPLQSTRPRGEDALSEVHLHQRYRPYIGSAPWHAYAALEELRASRRPLDSESGLVPLATPLLVGGLVPEVIAEWRDRLSSTSYAVTRGKATEPAFTGRYWNHKAAGIYRCV
ncbi:MAG: peptide-methionine (R)-S-oxide reductase, partial [Deltaproteobacteria bacterium]|nr:peptide-methionine (R)-S-oxide reductase [Deltaproteobacteria bacterium]